MKRFVEGADRGQSTLLPECLDDWIDEENPVRAIDAFVDALDLGALGFDGVEPAATGRPAFHPSVLLKLYIYGYLNRVQSSRRLEREASRNLELLWLLGRLVPDHKTIADFRKDNGPGLRQVCARFVELCRELGLLATASVAIDGSKFKAVNNRDKNFTKGKVERRRVQLEESVARYLAQLDTADRQESTEALIAKAKHLKEKLAKLDVEMQRLAAYEKKMLASPDQQISLTDPDSRSMATSGRGSGVVGYNVQVAVETDNHLIVTHEVTTSGSDRSQLARIGKAAKAVMRTDTLEAVADRGYFNSPEILECHEAGITVTLPKPMTSGAKSPHVPILERGGWQEAAALLDDGVRGLPDEIQMHDGAGAKDHAVAARACARCRAAAIRCQPKRDASAPRDGRASLRDHQGEDGGHALPDEDSAEGRRGNGAACAGLQSHPRDEHHRHQAADGDSHSVIRQPQIA
jgi:transposase